MLNALRLLVLAILLSGCAHAGSADPSPIKGETAGIVDRSCQVDADCAVKDVGNCCGYYPSCVNTNSPTFPDQVKADCAREGRMAVCGFPSISGCRCVENRCENVTGPGAEEI